MPARRPLLAVAVAGALLTPTTPARAAGYCSVRIPAQLSIDAPYERFAATLGSDCAAAGTEYASWDVRHSYHGPSDILIFDGETTDYLAMYDWEHTGTYYIEPSMAHDGAYEDVAQNTRTVTVRFASRLGLTSARSGSNVTLTVKASRYTPSAEGFAPWRGKAVTLQVATCATCAWANLKTVTTGSNGTASFTRYAPKARYYRAVAATTTATWGRTSATTTR